MNTEKEHTHNPSKPCCNGCLKGPNSCCSKEKEDSSKQTSSHPKTVKAAS